MDKETHILLFSYPVQGHINPMLQFSKRLASKGLRVTFVTTTSIGNSMQALPSQSINVDIISDGSEEAEDAESIDASLERYKLHVSQSLPKLIEKHYSSRYPPKILVYDSVMPWALEIARKIGIDGVPFFTQSCVVNAIYYHANDGVIQMPIEEGASISLPSIPSLGFDDLPSFLCNKGLYPALQKLVLNQFSNFQEANWLLCNTFNELENEVVNWMASQQWPVKTIGPAIPSIYLDKRLEDDKEYGVHLFKPDVDACMKWLNTKETDSVVYTSFGSLASLGEEQMDELTRGLKNSNCYFLWVVRETEQKKLPPNFLQETSEKGLVVSWCPQLEVLAHKAVGCFMTHCGWNSTLEALSLGVPMVAMPQWTDQQTNAKFIVDVWKVGVRIKLDERGIATKEEIELCIKEVIEGERGKEMKMNSVRWKELAKEAVDEGGSSDKNIEEFVAKLEAEDAESVDAALERFKLHVSQNLARLIEKHYSSKYPPKILVYDSILPWALEIARKIGIDGVPFFTQSCVVNAINYHANHGAIQMPIEKGASVSLPSIPSLGFDDLPSFLCDKGFYPAWLKLALNQFSNFQEANWLLCNTFSELENEVVNWMISQQWPVKTIGPAIPSIYLDKRLEDDKEYGVHLFKPDVDACMKWLDTKETDSVVYTSFGSLASLGEEQMDEVTRGLKNSNCYFLWVVRETEQKKLPPNFLQETSEKGLVVSWCPQLEVLAHKAVGCFMTHCGWNSTLEALSLGVPMVAMPVWTDQPTNAKFIVDAWKVGVRIKLDERGIATKEEIELCIKEVIEGERGKEMKMNSGRWKELAKEAVDEGGSSDKNIEEFVAKLVQS
ncbi:hypothetical protein ACJW31_04G011000 [Castanea mollissima]